MTGEHILRVAKKYEGTFQQLGAEAVRFEPAHPPSPAESRAHCLWMIGEIEKFVQAGEDAKAMRWLCFIQGVLWTNCMVPIDDMREDNRA